MDISVYTYVTPFQVIVISLTCFLITACIGITLNNIGIIDFSEGRSAIIFCLVLACVSIIPKIGINNLVNKSAAKRLQQDIEATTGFSVSTNAAKDILSHKDGKILKYKKNTQKCYAEKEGKMMEIHYTVYENKVNFYIQKDSELVPYKIENKE